MWVKLTKDTLPPPSHPHIGQWSYNGQEYTQHVVSWWYTHIYMYTPNIVCLCQRANLRQSCQDTNSWWKYNFDIEVNGQGQTKDMDVRDTSSHMPYMVWLCQRTKKLGPKTKPRHRPYRFDLEVKGQRQRDIISWWYTHKPNMVSQCQNKKS